ncbi:MAG: HEAT repeat domain-containing protein [Phycisphaerae bacterium]
MFKSAWVASCVCLVAAWTAGCASEQARREQLRSASALERARAAAFLAEAGDPKAVHSLVDLLEDSDDVVRMYGILALQRLCGESFGYQYHAAESQRTAAISRWREALREGRLRVRSQVVEPPETATPSDAPSASGGVRTGGA